MTESGSSKSAASFPALRFMLVFIGNEKRAILSSDVQEILRSAKVYELPFAPAFVEGMLNIRGEAYSVIDVLAALDEDGASNEGSEFLVFKYSGDRFCMRITSAETFFELPEEAFDRKARAVEYLGQKIPVLNPGEIEAALKKELELANG